MALETSELVRDSAIKRYEITVDIGWKVLKEYLEQNFGIITKSLKSTIREAFKQGIITHDEFWLKIIDIRNLSAHIYSEELAKEVYREINNAIPYFEKIKEIIEEE